MSEDWLADVRKYDPNPDVGVVDAIIRHCGIALRTRNASQVDFADPAETEKVRESFLKKKLGRTEDDATLDAAVTAVGARMGGAEDQNRVTVYYLLADHFDSFDIFGGTKRGAGMALAGAAATMAAASTSASASTSAATPVSPAPASAPAAPLAASPHHGSGGGDDGGYVAVGCITGLVAFGAILFAAIVALWADDPIEPAAAPAPAPVVAPAPAPVTEPEPVEVPEGAGVTATERDGKPLLTTYFDSGKADVTEDFGTAAAEILAYLEANPDATVAISGYNDPTGNAEINARLSKERAQNVRAALVALGVAEERTDLVKPEDTTTTDMTPAEARRVEVTIIE